MNFIIKHLLIAVGVFFFGLLAIATFTLSVLLWPVSVIQWVFTGYWQGTISGKILNITADL